MKLICIRMDTVQYTLVSYWFKSVRERALNMEICFLSWCLLLIYSMSVYLSHALGRCSSLISVLSAFGCAVWLCWCGTFYCVIFFHKECGRGLVGAELHELTALWMACHRFLFTSFVCFYRSLFICTHISYWWILYKTSDIL